LLVLHSITCVCTHVQYSRNDEDSLSGESGHGRSRECH